MPIIDGVWISDVEVALDGYFKGKCDPINTFPSWDVANLPPAFYPYLAYERNAIAYSPILDRKHQQDALIQADRLASFAGTEKALEVFEEIACFSYILQILPDPPVANQPNTGYNITVSPCRFEAATPAWQDYITEVVNKLVPINLPLQQVVVGFDGDEEIHYTGKGQVLDFLYVNGRIT